MTPNVHIRDCHNHLLKGAQSAEFKHLSFYTDGAVSMSVTLANTAVWYTASVKRTPHSFHKRPKSLKDHV